MISPTGRGIALDGFGVTAEIGTVAAVLRAVSVDGMAITEPTALGDAPAFANGIVLAPWPNRVRDGAWALDGERYQLPITEPARATAIHGLLRFADYEIREQSATEALLGAIIPPQTGWPAFMDTWVRYRLVPGGIDVTHGALNLWSDRAPYATGAHPFLRIGDVPAADLVLTVHADGWIEADDRLLPVRERDVAGTPNDLRAGRAVGGLALDTAFTRVRHTERDGGQGESARLTAPDGRVLSLRQDLAWRYLQVFTPTAFPAADGTARRAVAVEPMTAPPDALNSGEGLVWLEPGESWEGSWGLRLS